MGLLVRGRYAPPELRLADVDALALTLRSRSHARTDIAGVVGYSHRQVWRRLEAIAQRFDLTRPELLALAQILTLGGERAVVDPMRTRL